MGLNIREATPQDAPQWLDLLRCALGDDFPAAEAYDANWIKGQLQPGGENRTYVADLDGKLQAAISTLGPSGATGNPVTNLGRNLFRPESYHNGAAEALLRKIEELSAQEKHLIVVRILASDNSQQILFEKQGFICVGYQPFKHLHRSREGVLFYVHFFGEVLATRLPLSDSLPQISELAQAVLDRIQSSTPISVRDGVTGYPLKTELTFHESTPDDFDLWRMQAESANPSPEISGSYNRGLGYLRMAIPSQLRTYLGQREERVVAGIAFYLDEQDRCVRITDSFSSDDLSMGSMLHHVVKVAQDQLSAVYIEVDILMSAPRLLKSAEQLGFVPIAYLPAFYSKSERYADVVKLVKLNMGYALENTSLTTHAQGIVKIVDYNFQDQKIGVAIINLLRGLPIFEGLGDGELRKIARLFTQKLYRPAERVFSKGDSGKEAFIVMRGQVDIVLEENAAPIASVTSGQIFGELAFLDGAARGAHAVASQASILLVIQRSAFSELVQREPHLGMVVMRNVAMDLSNKLRRANTAFTPRR
jgi:hypothetical protein